MLRTILKCSVDVQRLARLQHVYIGLTSEYNYFAAAIHMVDEIFLFGGV